MTLQMGKNQPRRTAERASSRTPGPVSYWLIVEKRNNGLEALTIRTGGEPETLPVFSSEEEAETFLRFGGVSGGWRARESSAGELVSVLSDPCASVKKVALDPSSEMVVEGTVGLVSLLRESFVNLVVARRSGPLGLGGPEELGSTDHSLEAMDVRDTDDRHKLQEKPRASSGTRTGGLSIELWNSILEKGLAYQTKEKGDVRR